MKSDKTNYVYPKREDIETVVGDEKQPDFKPRMKIKKWDNEVNFSVGVISDHVGTNKRLINTVEWDDGHGVKARFYEKSITRQIIETDPIPDEPAFEFEIELEEKPASNVLHLSIETKGLNFKYQGGLTDKEIASDAIRPDNVVGSYAVYHSTMRDDHSKIGGKDYKTGKAFHIYRPSVKDAVGTKVWCDLNIDVDMQITIPQDFIDNAVYPIVVDPTFGYTSIGGSSITIDDVMRGYRGASLAGNAIVETLHAYVYMLSGEPAGVGSTPTYTKAALYDNNTYKIGGGQHSIDNSGSFLYQAQSSTGWKTYDVTDTEISSSSTYNIIVWGDAYYNAFDTNGACNVYYDTSGTGVYDSQTYGTFPTTAAFTNDTNDYSTYVTHGEIYQVVDATADGILNLPGVDATADGILHLPHTSATADGILGKFDIDKTSTSDGILEEESDRVTYQNKSETKQTSGTTCTISAPAGFSQGDLFIAMVTHYDNSAITRPSGWTLIQSSSSRPGMDISYRIAQTGDTSWGWTVDSTYTYGVILRYTGHDETTPIIGSAKTTGSGTSYPVAPSASYTNAFAGSISIQCFGESWGDTPYTTPNELTERYSDKSNLVGMAGGDKVVASGSQSTGTVRFILDGACNYHWEATIVINKGALTVSATADAILQELPWTPVHPKLIAQDTAGTFDCNVAAYTNVPFNSLLIEDDDTVIEQTANTTYRLKEAGHYLVTYNVASRNDTYANRQEFMTQLYLESAAIHYGRGQSYRRLATDDRCSCFGGTIINASALDDLSVQVIRSGTNANTHLLEADRSGLQILRLDDTHEFFRAISTDTSNIATATYHDITWNTEDEKDASFTHAANSATITLATGYKYLVCYNIRSQGAGVKRTTLSTRVTLDTVESEYGWAYTYMRGQQGCDDGCASAMFLVDASSGAKDMIVQGRALNAVETDTQALVSGESAITIWRLPSWAECLMVHSSNDQDCSGQTGIIIHETEDVEDATSFNHSTSTGRVTMVGDRQDYLFMYGGRAYKTGTGTTRTSFGATWRKDATIQDYGRAFCYLRGVEASGGNTMDGGINCATIFDGLEAGDIIDIALSDEGGDGDAAENLITDQHGMCAINLCDIFTTPPSVGVRPPRVFYGPFHGPLGGPI